MLAKEFLREPESGINVAQLKSIAEEVRANPTNEENVFIRCHLMGQTAEDLLNRGAQIGHILPGKKADTIHRLLDDDQLAEAVPLVDEALRQLCEVSKAEGRPKGPQGTIAGVVEDSRGKPVANAVVSLFGTNLKTKTDAKGKYALARVPVYSPRHILLARANGFIEGQAGDIGVKDGAKTEVNFSLVPDTPERAYLKEDLLVKLAYVEEMKPTRKKPEASPDAVLDPNLYPANVKPYLGKGLYIDPTAPAIVKLAERIKSTVPPGEQKKQRTVAKAVYDWIVKNIEYDLIFNYPGDITCGQWQTTYGGWGHSFNEWCYRPEEVASEGRAICIEYERFAAAIMRALQIPARPSPLRNHPVTEWWVQLPDGTGYWSFFETSIGHTRYHETGNLTWGFPSREEHVVAFRSIDAGAPIQMYWQTDRKTLWLEDYGEVLIVLKDGQSSAKVQSSIEEFQRTGCLPLVEAVGAVPVGRRVWDEHYELTSRGFRLSLANIGDQRKLVVRFPIFMTNQYRHVARSVHWTNHPEWVTRVHNEEESNPDTGEKLDLYYVEFELGKKK